jgi:hypothetical protein
MKKQSCLPLAISFAVIPLMVCGLALWFPMSTNNLRLEKFAKKLYDYPLPPDTTVIEQHAVLSKLGNGNNCSYEAQQSLVSTLPREEIEHYYEGVMLPRVSFGAQYDGLYDSPTVTKIRLEFEESQTNERKSSFTLTLFDVGSDVTLDIRCH